MTRPSDRAPSAPSPAAAAAEDADAAADAAAEDADARLRALFDWCAAGDGLDAPWWGPLVDAVLDRFAVDRARYSDILEPSLAVHDGAVHRCRFSYAFPGYRADPAGTGRALVALARPLGEIAVAAAATLLRAARHPAVAHPLVGFAADPAPGPRADASAASDVTDATDAGDATATDAHGARPRRHRFKLYLQMRPDAALAPAALDLARALTGLRGTFPPTGDATLHLVGLDVGARGIVGARLYFDRPDGGLDIHRLAHPDDPSAARPSAVDFPVADSPAAPLDLGAHAPVASPAARAAVAELRRAFPVRVRRVSRPLDGDGVTVYYVLADVPTGVKPSGGG